MKILIRNMLKIDNDDIKMLETHGYGPIEFFDTVEESDAEVIVGSIATDTESLKKFPNLKLLHILPAGFDSLDLEALKKRGVMLVNGKGVYSRPIAEYIIGKVLAWAKKDQEFYKQQMNKEWTRINEGMLELTDKTVGILGTGSIAQDTARLLKAFDCKVLGLNTSGKPVEHFDNTFAIDEMKTVFNQSDIVICTLPLNEKTYHLLGKEEFLAMKKDALFINIGRGKEVVEKELIEILDTHLSQVVLDVFEQEPLPKESPLWHHPKVIITPHNSSDSDIVDARRKTYVLENLMHYSKNEEIENRVI